jgi:hypothetical protein
MLGPFDPQAGQGDADGAMAGKSRMAMWQIVNRKDGMSAPDFRRQLMLTRKIPAPHARVQ